MDVTFRMPLGFAKAEFRGLDWYIANGQKILTRGREIFRSRRAEASGGAIAEDQEGTRCELTLPATRPLEVARLN